LGSAELFAEGSNSVALTRDRERGLVKLFERDGPELMFHVELRSEIRDDHGGLAHVYRRPGQDEWITRWSDRGARVAHSLAGELVAVHV